MKGSGNGSIFHRLKIIPLMLAASVLFSSCTGGAVTSSKTLFAMDTYMTLKADVPQQLLDECASEIDALDAVFSCNSESSELYRLNRNGGGNASDRLLYVISQSLDYARKTDGAFNPALYPVIKLWNIADFSGVPSEADIKKAVDSSDYSKISISGSNISLSGSMLDLGAIAKGYAADVITKMLIDGGATGGVLSLGGAISLIGDNGGRGYTVAVQDPRSESGLEACRITQSGCFVVTSGDYQRYAEVDGVRYHHIFGRNGYPADNGLMSVTIIADSGTAADALSTALFVMGLQGALDYYAENGGFEAIFITTEKKIYCTSGIADKVKITGDGYEYGGEV